jgi:hypothetical protein
VFTLPVAMVFRQMIAHVLGSADGAAVIAATTRPSHHPAVLEPFPASELTYFPKVLSDVLPALPAPLEYRLIGQDLVIRDVEGDIIVAVLRSALGVIGTKH